ncbi:unnamed protein product, partial [Phaeothamnion confervicola]
GGGSGKLSDHGQRRRLRAAAADSLTPRSRAAVMSAVGGGGDGGGGGSHDGGGIVGRGASRSKTGPLRSQPVNGEDSPAASTAERSRHSRQGVGIGGCGLGPPLLSVDNASASGDGGVSFRFRSVLAGAPSEDIAFLREALRGASGGGGGVLSWGFGRGCTVVPPAGDRARRTRFAAWLQALGFEGRGAGGGRDKITYFVKRKVAEGLARELAAAAASIKRSVSEPGSAGENVAPVTSFELDHRGIGVNDGAAAAWRRSGCGARPPNIFRDHGGNGSGGDGGCGGEGRGSDENGGSDRGADVCDGCCVKGAGAGAALMEPIACSVSPSGGTHRASAAPVSAGVMGPVPLHGTPLPPRLRRGGGSDGN